MWEMKLMWTALRKNRFSIEYVSPKLDNLASCWSHSVFCAISCIIVRRLFMETIPLFCFVFVAELHSCITPLIAKIIHQPALSTAVHMYTFKHLSWHQEGTTVAAAQVFRRWTVCVRPQRQGSPVGEGGGRPTGHRRNLGKCKSTSWTWLLWLLAVTLGLSETVTWDTLSISFNAGSSDLASCV